jgi:inward rectifier potassium channel
MAQRDKITNSGFDTTGSGNASRYYDKEGNSTIKRVGVNFLERFSLFHEVLNMSNLKFLLLIFCIYFLINILFAFIYFAIGVDTLGIATTSRFCWKSFADCFFFSAQTLTTVGYGRISPISFSANAIAAFESLIGLLLFSLVTGISYGRFAKPKSKLRFSDFALITKYQDITGLMMRFVSPSKYVLSDVTASMTLAIMEEENGVWKQNFYPLKLETDKIVSLVLSWTLVHPITEDSPFYGLTLADLKQNNAEIFIYVRGFDEHFSATVQQRSSYTASEIRTNQKFVKMFGPDAKSGKIAIRIDDLNKVETI